MRKEFKVEYPCLLKLLEADNRLCRNVMSCLDELLDELSQDIVTVEKSTVMH